VSNTEGNILLLKKLLDLTSWQFLVGKIGLRLENSVVIAIIIIIIIIIITITIIIIEQC
jgi:hypothetical protein